MNYYNTAYKNTKALFSKSKKEKELLFKERKEKIHKACPEIAEIDKKILLNISSFTVKMIKI